LKLEIGRLQSKKNNQVIEKNNRIKLTVVKTVRVNN